jgi:hypothetical protein
LGALHLTGESFFQNQLKFWNGFNYLKIRAGELLRVFLPGPVYFSTWRFKKMRRRICLSLLIVLSAGFLFAQQSLISGVNRLRSPERYWKIKLLFTDDADAFMDPNDYRSLEFESFFAEAQASQFAGGQSLSGGAAGRLGQMYTSFFFDGTGGNFVFGPENALSVMVGAGSAGAFKSFFEKRIAGARFGLGYGINFEAGATILKPEVMVSYSNAKGADYNGIFGAGAALGIVFVPVEGEASLDIQYELKFGVPENGGSYRDHYATVVYRRLYDMADDFSAGWGLGAAGWFVKQKNADALKYGVLPLADLGFTYQMDGVFGINGQLVIAYTTDHDSMAGNVVSSLGGFDVIPVLGMSFTPHEYLKIEMGAQYNSLEIINPWSFMLLASFRK